MKIISYKKNQQKEIIHEATQVLKQGGLIIYPTDTVYGLGADPTNALAIKKLLAYKSKRQGKPLSIAVSDLTMARQYAVINDQASKIYQQFLPGPYTVISKVKNNLTPGVASEFATIGIRIPDYQLITELIKAFQKPITATSANQSNEKRPYKITDVLQTLSERQKKLIDLIIDAGELAKNDPSTIIDTTLSTPVVLRKRTQEKITQFQVEEFISQSETDTFDLAQRLCLKYQDKIGQTGLIFTLNGPLGAGKTIFAKGVAKYLEIKDNINSPTYSYLNEYPFSKNHLQGMFYHVDCWKIACKEEYELLELEKLCRKNQVIVIEWFETIEKYLKKALCFQVNIEILETSSQHRKIIYHEK